MLRSATPPTIPHIGRSPASGLARCFDRALPCCDCDLARTRQRELPGRCIAGDGRTRSDRSAVADLYRRHQHAARADEGSGADPGLPLVGTIVVAGDRAGTDIDRAPNLAVADVGEVIGLAARANDAVFDLDEVAEVHAVGQLRLRPQTRERPDLTAGADPCAV